MHRSRTELPSDKNLTLQREVCAMTEITDAFPELTRELRFEPLGVDHPRVLSRAQIEQYNEQGFIASIDVFSASEIGAVRAYVDDLLARAMQAGWGNYELTNWHKYCRGIWDLVTDRRIVDIVADLLGDSVVLRHSHFFAKLPGDGKQVSWHQDASYWPLSRSRVVSAWLAVDEVAADNAPMKVIPGSHRLNQLAFANSAPEERNVLNQTVPQAGRFGTPVPLLLRPGQISLHSDWILHGSDVNGSNRRRCGLAMRYLSADVRAYHGWHAHSVICRGADPSGHWANHPRPPGEQIPTREEAASATDRSLKPQRPASAASDSDASVRDD